MKVSNDSMVPIFGIIYYEGMDTSYLEKGKFVKKKDQYVLQGLRPFTSDELLKLQTITVNEKGLYLDGVIPKNMVYLNQYPSNAMVAWIEPCAIRFINFKDKSLRGKYEVPNTLFFTKNNKVYIYLVKNKDIGKFSMETDLYLSHYYNVYENGRLCIGSGYRPNIDYMSVTELMDKVSKNFWAGSYFTHSHIHEAKDDVWLTNKGIYPEKLWKKSRTLKKLVSGHLMDS